MKLRCDGLVFYYRGSEKTFCFVELKGNKVDMAVKQVVNTYECLKGEIKASLKRRNCEVQMEKISWKACICLKSSVPKNPQDSRKLLEETFGKGNYIIQASRDLGPFLRKREK